MAAAAAPPPSCFNCCCCCCFASKPKTSISSTNFPLSFSCPIFNGRNGISVTRTGFSSRTYAKFEKFQGDPSEANLADTTASSVQTQEQTVEPEDEEEDDSCLPSDLEGAVRQSGEASALFVSSGGMKAIVELLIPQLQFLDDEGAQAELWELSRIFLDTLIEETGCQTGSGKTYTMMGRPQAPEQKGLIPRSLEQIFENSQSLQAQGWKYKVQASMLEIYNETIRDLLSTNRSAASESAVSGKKYTIKHDANGNTYVSDLTVVDVSSITEISSLLRQAAHSRSVGRTQMNEESSRSHMVFTLRISGINEGTEQQVQGVLNLIDLAGSERLSRSGATGDRLKETQAINKSLSCLSDVIFALARKEDHVPFRNSKLTYLLQPCLGGDSKTLMFVNVSPDSSSVGESLCSLRFASRVNACEIGVPRLQMTFRPADCRLSCG